MNGRGWRVALFSVLVVWMMWNSITSVVAIESAHNSQRRIDVSDCRSVNRLARSQHDLIYFATRSLDEPPVLVANEGLQRLLDNGRANGQELRDFADRTKTRDCSNLG